MSHHNSGLDLDRRSSDARSHLTDLYVFQKPGDPDKTVLVANVNPLSPISTEAVNSESAYQFLVDTDATARPNLTFSVQFSPVHDGAQSATVWLAQGGEQDESPFSGKAIIEAAPVSLGSEPHIASTGDFRFFAGLRSDPFFTDAEGAANNFQWTGRDSFADKNVFAIVLEVPNHTFGPRPAIGVWARVLVSHDGDLVQGDRVGRPNIDALFNQSADESLAWNRGGPEHDRELSADRFAAILTHAGGYFADQSIKIAENLLPDILTYDYSKSSGYPNGRKLTDDVSNISLAMLTNGAVSSDGLLPQRDLLVDFPYLGDPH